MFCNFVEKIERCCRSRQRKAQSSSRHCCGEVDFAKWFYGRKQSDTLSSASSALSSEFKSSERKPPSEATATLQQEILELEERILLQKLHKLESETPPELALYIENLKTKMAARRKLTFVNNGPLCRDAASEHYEFMVLVYTKALRNLVNQRYEIDGSVWTFLHELADFGEKLSDSELPARFVKNFIHVFDPAHCLFMNDEIKNLVSTRDEEYSAALRSGDVHNFQKIYRDLYLIYEDIVERREECFENMRKFGYAVAVHDLQPDEGNCEFMTTTIKSKNELSNIVDALSNKHNDNTITKMSDAQLELVALNSLLAAIDPVGGVSSDSWRSLEAKLALVTPDKQQLFGDMEIPSFQSSEGSLEAKLDDQGNTTEVLNIPSFDAKVAKDMEAKIRELNEQKVDKVVLNLRGNKDTDSSFTQLIAGLFLPEGVVVYNEITSQRKRDLYTSAHATHNNNVVYKGALTVLVDRTCGSAAEVLTAALKAHNRALVIGETTSGQGTTQQPWSIKSEQHGEMITLKMPQLVYGPAGEVIKQEGVKPDVDLSHGLRVDTGIEVTDRPLKLRRKFTPAFHKSLV